MAKTIENCRVIRRAAGDMIGKHQTTGDCCEGYCTQSDDEPCEECKRCRYLRNWEALSDLQAVLGEGKA